MTTKTASQTVNATTAAAATQKVTLSPGSTMLIGIIQTPKGGAALVRLRSGEVRKLRPGDRLPGAQVIAVEPDRVLLREGTTQKSLRLPG